MIAIGIDPGTMTGVAVWDADVFNFREIEAMTILNAFDRVKEWHGLHGDGLFVIVEDARQRKGGFKKADEDTEKYGAGVREAVGSVKRDCSIWEEFLRSRGIQHEFKYPRRTKLSAEQFRRLSPWAERTNQHERDAAMIVLQLNNPILRLKLQTYLQRREMGNESSLPSGARLRGRRSSRR